MDLNKPLQTQLYDNIKRRILDGELDKDTLHSETKLAKELSVSRTPLRDALRYLEQDGYIIIVPSRGFRIRKLDREGLRASIEIRCAIEGYCVYRVAEQFGSEEVKALTAGLEDILVKMEFCLRDTSMLEQFIDYDHAFHSRLIAYVDVKDFQTEFQKIYFMIRQTSENSLKVEGRIRATYEEHRDILWEIRAGRAVEAYQAMLHHLREPLCILESCAQV